MDVRMDERMDERMGCVHEAGSYDDSGGGMEAALMVRSRWGGPLWLRLARWIIRRGRYLAVLVAGARAATSLAVNARLGYWA